jgi:hypothetical protein
MNQSTESTTSAPLSDSDALRRFNEAAAFATSLSAPNEAFNGRGIVIAAGGLKYLPCAWVCIKMLRQLGCKLPVEVWHLGNHEMPDGMQNLLASLNVNCIDATAVSQKYPARRLGGWELKAYSIIHSRFREVLLLDADNVVTVDPSFLFHTEPYLATGAIFWPDYNRLAEDRMIWQLTGIPFRLEPEFESGQIVVDKVKCWAALSLTMWLNEYSDFWYRHVHGDKETFHLAWRKLNLPYAMPARGIHPLPGTMCQHDFEGNRIFQHRNCLKWSLDGNPTIAGFEFEEDCLRHLDELRLYGDVLGGAPYHEHSRPRMRRPTGQRIRSNQVRQNR